MSLFGRGKNSPNVMEQQATRQKKQKTNNINNNYRL